jgi:hypothetical protein
MPPQPALVFVAVAACLYVTGDGLCTFGLGLRPSRHPARILLAMGAGLLLLVALGANLYLWGAVPTVGALSPGLPLALAAISVAGWLRAPARAPSPAAIPAWIASPLLAAAAVGTALVLWPMLASGGPGGFYYSNNGEFSTYAALADLVLRIPAGAPLDLPIDSAFTREGIVGVLCGVLARLLHVPPIFLVQPLGAVLAAMFFAGLALWLAAYLARAGARAPGVALAAVVLGGFLASAVTQAVWTLSFLSQYVAFALFGAVLGWLPWAELPGASARAKIVGAGLAGGLLASTALLVYPEQAPLILAFGLLFALPRWSLGGRALARSVATGAGVALATGPLGIRFLVDRMRLGLGSGWDLFGQGWLAVATNLAGFTSRFWGGIGPSILPTAGLAAFAVLLALAIASGVRALATDRRSPLGIAAAGSLAVLAGTALLFGWAVLDERQSSYAAVKFASGYLWIPVLTVAAWAATAVRRASTGVAVAAIAVVATAHVAGGVAFARGVASDADATRLLPWDLGVGARVIPPDETPFLLTATRRRLDGTQEEIAKYHLDALYLWKGSIEPDPEGRVMNHPAFQATGQRWIISPHLRENGATTQGPVPPGFVRVVDRPGYAIYRLP